MTPKIQRRQFPKGMWGGELSSALLLPREFQDGSEDPRELQEGSGAPREFQGGSAAPSRQEKEISPFLRGISWNSCREEGNWELLTLPGIPWELPIGKACHYCQYLMHIYPHLSTVSAHGSQHIPTRKFCFSQSSALAGEGWEGKCSISWENPGIEMRIWDFCRI